MSDGMIEATASEFAFTIELAGAELIAQPMQTLRSQTELTEATDGTSPSRQSPQSTELPEACQRLSPTVGVPRATKTRRKVQPQATQVALTIGASPAAEIQEAKYHTLPQSATPPVTELGGPTENAHHFGSAAQTETGEGRSMIDTQCRTALVGEINVVKRRYDDLRRARQRLELQAMATCRSYLGGDKEAGAKLYRLPTVEISAWLAPYVAAMEPLDAAISEQEKLLTKLGKQLPVIEWAGDVAGLSPRFLAMIVGECGVGPGEYRTVSALWKRMGLAVIGGERQRRVTGDAAIEHGYVARRRSLMWNIGESIIKQQVRKGDDETRHAIGPYGQVYLDRKVYEATKTDKPIIAHNRAKRYMEKRLLRELWRAWRRACSISETDTLTPASEVI